MKKISFIIIFVVSSILLTAQEKGSYITVSGGLGATGLKYDLKSVSSDGVNQFKLGANGLIGYSYYFTRHWGVGTGLGISYYNTHGRYFEDFKSSQYYNLGNQIDDDNLLPDEKNYELRARLANWDEKQTAYFLEIPILIQFQHKFGSREWFGIYFGAGIKLQIPVSSKYKVIDSKYEGAPILNVSGYYPASGIDFNSPNDFSIPYHGFGNLHNPNEMLDWNGDVDLKLSVAGTAELGVLFNVRPRLDITLGAYLDYGFNNIKKGNSKVFIQAPENYLPEANDNVGKGIIYNGMINSDRTDKVNLMSYGIKVGLRIKIGKIEKEYYISEVDEVIFEPVVVVDNCCDLLKSIVDTLSRPVIQNVITQHPEGEAIKFPHILFDLDKYDLKPKSIEVLKEIAEFLDEHHEYNLKIFGNTDDIAGDNINIPLGLNRAKAAKDYLVKELGVASYRISIFTQSSYDPYVPNLTAEDRAENRRCEFEVYLAR